MKKILAVIFIIIALGLIINLWFSNFKHTFYEAPPLKEDGLFFLLLNSFSDSTKSLEESAKDFLNDSAAAISTEEALTETSVSSDELLTKEQLEILKEKIKNFNEEKK